MKNFTLLFFAALFFTACSKKNDSSCMPVSPQSEAGSMAAYCTAHGLNCTVDSNGIYYQIIDEGSGITPTETSVITVTYTASTLDGTLIEDQTSSPTTATLNQFIEGWRIAIPYIQKGGHIKMIIPSSLAYGCTGNNSIPPNSPLYFDVVLVNVN
ncbi:MAG: FKBP-type peptidyl-prolyl cis-trans isomerase [Parafilimonas sp.]